MFKSYEKWEESIPIPQTLPEQEDCSTDIIPAGAALEGAAPLPKGKRRVLIPEYATMNKYLFDNYKKDMYDYIHRCKRTGELDRITWTHVRDVRSVTFPSVTFWRIDREDFYSDVNVRLALDTDAGEMTWNGILVMFCSFLDGFTCEAEQLVDKTDREEYDRLSSYLVPIYTNKRVDELSEKMWEDYGMPEALNDPAMRNASELAKRAGLDVQFFPIYEHEGVDSILFFADDRLLVGEDRVNRNPDGSRDYIKAEHGTWANIPASTIVINSNRRKKEYSAYDVFHEIFHNEHHYLFFSLQRMCSDDPRKVKLVEKIINADEEVKDPIYFAEKQATRGGYALLMPARDTWERINGELYLTDKNLISGDRFQQVGFKVAAKLHVAAFQIRVRMVQLGFIEAKGAINYVDRKLINPFSFHDEALREPQHTYVISSGSANKICRDEPVLRDLIGSGKYVYVDGHVVRNDSRFVMRRRGSIFLTDRALAHIDDCCLRFTKVYEQDYLGRYSKCRMYFDPHYVERTQFFLQDVMNEKHLDELDAKPVFEKDMKESFEDALADLMHTCGETQESMAEKFNISPRTWRYWLDDPEEKFTRDRLIALSLFLELPDWVSALLFKRLDCQMGDRKRSRALEYIRTVMWDQGVDKANDYLVSHGLAKLKL